jgi:RNA polymerase sigma factor for flagellar operon FliA
MHTIGPAHIRRVKAIASRVQARTPADREELVGYGLLGLANAARRFDGSHGVRFQTFADQRVSWAIVDGLRQLDPLTRRERRELRAGTAPGDVKAARIRAATSPLPWEHEDFARGPSGESMTLAELVPDPGAPDPAEEVERIDLQDRVGRALEKLNWRERWLIHLRFDAGLTLAEIGEQMGVSESRASQLQRETLAKLAPVLAEDDAGEDLAA